MQSPVVAWIKTFSRVSTSCNSIQDLVNGVLLNEIMVEIDSTHFGNSLGDVRRIVDQDSKIQIHNLGVLLENLTSYFQDVLQTIIIMELPIIPAIVRDPESDAGILGIKKFIMLMLCCSVQCENNEKFVDKIKGMDKLVQVELMTLIKKVMDSLIKMPGDDMDPSEFEDLRDHARMICSHLNRVVVERDNCLQTIDELKESKKNCELKIIELESSMETSKVMKNFSPEQSSSTHKMLESAQALRLQLRLLTDELDQKSLALEHLMLDEAKNKQTISSLNAKIRQLTHNVEEAQVLRDDLDMWRAKASEAERLKAEVTRYRERLEDFDYLKRQVEELKERNILLAQQNANLKESEEGIEALQVEMATDKRENRTLKIQMQELTASLEASSDKIHELNTEKLRLESEREHYQKEMSILKQDVEVIKEQANLRSPARLPDIETVSKLEHSRLQSDFSDVKRQLDQANASLIALRELETANTSLSRSLTVSKIQMQDFERDLKFEKEKNASLQRQMAEMQEELEKSVGKGREYAMGLAQAYTHEKRKMMQLESKLDSALNKSVELKEERIRVLELRLDDLVAENSQLKEEVKLYQRQTDLLRGQTSTHRSTATSPTALKLDALPIKRSHETLELPHAESKLTTPLSSSHASLTVSHNTRGVSPHLSSPNGEKERAESSALINQLVEENDRLKRDNDQGILSLKSAATTIERLQQELDEVQEDNDALRNMVEEDLGKAKELCMRLREKNEAFAASMNTLSVENDKLKLKVKLADKASSKSAQREADLAEQLKSTRQNHDSIQAENASLLDQISSLLVHNQELTFKISTMKDSLDKLTRQGSQASIGSKASLGRSESVMVRSKSGENIPSSIRDHHLSPPETFAHVSFVETVEADSPTPSDSPNTLRRQAALKNKKSFGEKIISRFRRQSKRSPNVSREGSHSNDLAMAGSPKLENIPESPEKPFPITGLSASENMSLSQVVMEGHVQAAIEDYPLSEAPLRKPPLRRHSNAVPNKRNSLALMYTNSALTELLAAPSHESLVDAPPTEPEHSHIITPRYTSHGVQMRRSHTSDNVATPRPSTLLSSPPPQTQTNPETPAREQDSVWFEYGTV